MRACASLPTACNRWAWKRRPCGGLYADGHRGGGGDAGCARIGAIHSWCLRVFRQKACLSGSEDARAKVVITADEGMRGGKAVALKRAVDEALAMGDTSCVERVMCIAAPAGTVNWNARDLWVA